MYGAYVCTYALCVCMYICVCTYVRVYLRFICMYVCIACMYLCSPCTLTEFTWEDPKIFRALNYLWEIPQLKRCSLININYVSIRNLLPIL